MEQDKEIRLKEYAKEKVVARLVKNVKEDTARKDAVARIYNKHAPTMTDLDSIILMGLKRK